MHTYSILDFIIQLLLAGGVGILIVTFLSKRLLTQMLNKEMVAFKEEIRTKFEIELATKKEGQKIQSESLSELWKVCSVLTEYCKTRNENNLDIGHLNQLVDNVDKRISMSKAFISTSTLELVREIADCADTENFTISSINEIVRLENKLSKLCRKFLLIE